MIQISVCVLFLSMGRFIADAANRMTDKASIDWRIRPGNAYVVLIKKSIERAKKAHIINFIHDFDGKSIKHSYLWPILALAEHETRNIYLYCDADAAFY